MPLHPQARDLIAQPEARQWPAVREVPLTVVGEIMDGAIAWHIILRPRALPVSPGGARSTGRSGRRDS